jgi:ABC-type transporter Mla subunit MlaD
MGRTVGAGLPIGKVTLHDVLAAVDAHVRAPPEITGDPSGASFNGAGYDLQTLLDSSAKISHDASDTADHTRTLVDDAVPFLDAQAQTSDATRRWAHNLAGVTDQLVTDDPQFRKLLATGPGFSQEVSRLLNQLKPTLPVLLANLTTIGQIGVTYHPSLEQLLVLLPPSVAAYGSYGVVNNPTGLAVGGFTLTIADPPACTVGFLPPSQWRSPAETDTIDTPTICTANFRKTPPSPCAVCATIPAWVTPESGPRPSRSATATSPISL